MPVRTHPDEELLTEFARPGNLEIVDISAVMSTVRDSWHQMAPGRVMPGFITPRAYHYNLFNNLIPNRLAPQGDKIGPSNESKPLGLMFYFPSYSLRITLFGHCKITHETETASAKFSRLFPFLFQLFKTSEQKTIILIYHLRGSYLQLESTR